MGNRKTILGLALSVLLFAGCTPNHNPDNPTTPSPPSTSLTPNAIDLTQPGKARQIVNELIKFSAGYPVIKLEITKDYVSLAVVIDSVAHTYQWQDGEISEINSSTEYYDQASFDPSQYALDNVNELFAKAAKVSGSDHEQMLQVVEYNRGQALITVTTHPETQPVFFRPDGSLISEIDLTTVSGTKQALSDTVGGVESVIAIGYSQETGFWADLPDLDKKIVVRRTRPKRTPMYEAPRRGDVTLPTFDPQLVDAQTLTELFAKATTEANLQPDEVELWIYFSKNLAKPVIEITVNGKSKLFDLAGNPMLTR